MKKWKKYRIEIASSAEEAVTAVLYELGIVSIEIEDSLPLTDEEKKFIFADVMPEDTTDDGRAYIMFYLDEGEDSNEVLTELAASIERMRTFMDPGSCEIEISETAEEDWINNWKKYFHTFSIDNVMIVPSWEEAPSDASDKLLLHIDPGTAFGTGKHETTRSCIRALSRYIRKGDTMLDIGTGSGILMLLSLKLGAGFAYGTDLDPNSESAVQQNMKANAVADEQFKMYLGNLITDDELRARIGRASCSIAAANILSEVLIPMMPAAYELIKPDGIYICGGIIMDKEEAVRKALIDNGFMPEETIYDGEWVCIVSRKNRKEG